MSNELHDDLLAYVTSEGRVYPIPWAEFSELIGLNRPGFLPPLILGGAMESDAAKRRRLLDQIAHIADDPDILATADTFLRSLSDDQWYRAEEPLSDHGKW